MVRGDKVVDSLAVTPQALRAQASPKTYVLNATPQTVHVAHFRSDLKPVLTVNSGDSVVVQTFRWDPAQYEAYGIAPECIPQEFRDLYKELKEYKGHELTGPIYINGAEPGDMLEVRILDVKITTPFGFNCNLLGYGTLPEEFQYNAYRVLPIDFTKMTSEILPGVVVPLKPFFGVMAVSPPASMGKVSSISPGIYGGNLDNKELVAGTKLYLPVHVKGALFSAGDGHAVQGDGEVNISALETSLTGTFQFIVHKNKRIVWPRAETPTHFITMGLDTDLNVAGKNAVREMLEYLREEKGINKENGYMLSSLAVDLHVTQTVDGVKGIHAMLPKSIFVQR